MGTEDTIEMVIIKNDTVIKKKFSVIDEDEVISLNLGNFFIAVRKEDLKKYL
jgi:chaperonin cofactor prefoldin